MLPIGWLRRLAPGRSPARRWLTHDDGVALCTGFVRPDDHRPAAVAGEAGRALRSTVPPRWWLRFRRSHAATERTARGSGGPGFDVVHGGGGLPG